MTGARVKSVCVSVNLGERKIRMNEVSPAQSAEREASLPDLNHFNK